MAEKYGIFEFSNIISGTNALKKFQKQVNRKMINYEIKNGNKDTLIRTWRSICVLWKDILGAYSKDKKDDTLKPNNPFITRPSGYMLLKKAGELENHERSIVAAYLEFKDDYENLSKKLTEIEKKFSNYYKRESRKMDRMALKKGELGSIENINAQMEYKTAAHDGKETDSLGPVTDRVNKSLAKLINYTITNKEGKDYLEAQNRELEDLLADIKKFEISKGMKDAILNFFTALKNCKNISSCISCISQKTNDKFFDSFLDTLKDRKTSVSYTERLRKSLANVNEVINESDKADYNASRNNQALQNELKDKLSSHNKERDLRVQ